MEEDLEKILIPRFDIDDVVVKINNSASIAVELVGKQGRGKSAHLQCLSKRMTQYPIFLLNPKTMLSDVLENRSNVIFVDSIHHLSLFNRLKLLRSKKKVVYTTHWSKKWECMLAGKPHYSIALNGVNTATLTEILNRRLEFASTSALEPVDIFTTKEAELMVQKFGDNYRGIINHLYKRYQ